MKDMYLEQLKNPNKKARVWTRWWWYGCAVKKEDIIFQLDQMAAVNLGGVEIQILYALTRDNKSQGITNIDYFSPAFFEILIFTVTEAKKRNILVDMTLGSSWPFGGPFVSFDQSAPVVHPYIIDVSGPKQFSYDFTTRISGNIVGCIMGKMEHSQMLPHTIIDLQPKLQEKKLFNWPWGFELKNIEIPAGDYKIVCFVSSAYREHVLAPTKGAEGLVIDHNRKDVARMFFQQAGTPIVQKLGKGAIHAFFCDSIEVAGHNWTDIIYEEFEQRRGYKLQPYIYALWGEIKDITQEIRYDFQKTMAELTVENFFEEMTTWCHEMGSLCRIQAHGTWGDILKAYGAADIPEGETFSALDQYQVNTVHRRLASSAAHIYNKPICSNESYTWLRFPRFTETLEQIKVATDSIFVDGINQIINHGYSYTQNGEEEWAFYASSHICHTNTWWKHYKNISDYVNRVSDFLQRGENYAEVCVYLPQHDIWAENPLSDLHMTMKLEERLQTDAIHLLQENGYWFDYVNDDVIQNWEKYPYQVIILMEVDRLPLDTARKLAEAAAKGKKVICCERLPSLSCGFLSAETNHNIVKSLMEELEKNRLLYKTKDKRQSLICQLEEIFVPDLRIEAGQDNIGYVHRQVKKDTVETENTSLHTIADKSGFENQDIYFISNMSPQNISTSLYFKNQTNHFIILDPLSVTEKPINFCQIHQKESFTNVEVNISFEAYQSILVIFDKTFAPVNQGEKEADKGEALIHQRGKEIDLSENWLLEVKEKNFSTMCGDLKSWEQYPELAYYSGTVNYTKKIYLEEGYNENKSAYLELEHLGASASVYINNHLAGDIIKQPYKIKIDQYLKEGENKIQIDATNLLINRYLDPEWKLNFYEGDLIDEWPYFTKSINPVREKRLSNWREKAMIQNPLPSGIWGSVKIILA